jgi:hypothetical protein
MSMGVAGGQMHIAAGNRVGGTTMMMDAKTLMMDASGRPISRSNNNNGGSARTLGRNLHNFNVF